MTASMHGVISAALAVLFVGLLARLQYLTGKTKHPAELQALANRKWIMTTHLAAALLGVWLF